MKVKKILFLVMAICLASGVRAQFYDSANDIYYYVVESKDGTSISKQYQDVYVFNFDGRRACQLANDRIKTAQSNLRENSDYYGAMVETKKYDMEYTSSSYGTCYVRKDFFSFDTEMFGTRNVYETLNFIFSSDRKTLKIHIDRHTTGVAGSVDTTTDYVLKRVDKDYILNGFFGEGRQRR